MKKIGIVGAGTMGSGIACAAALAGFDVSLNDVSEEILKRAKDRISEDLRKGVERGKLTTAQAASAEAKVNISTHLQDLSPCSVVIEAALESLEIKEEIFSRLDALCPSDSILATNTSSLSVTAIASSTKQRDRVVGMHFFNPARLMNLVEIVRTEYSSESTIQRTVDLAKQMGKRAVVVKDTPGFIVNRVARPFYGEALRILGEGVASVQEIDRIVRLEGGFKMGPFELMDLIGIDVNFTVTQSMYEQTFGEPRYRPHVIQKNMVHAGYLGRKTQRGFYRYDR